MVAAELSAELYKNQILEVFWRFFARPVAAGGGGGVGRQCKINSIDFQNDFFAQKLKNYQMLAVF